MACTSTAASQTIAGPVQLPSAACPRAARGCSRATCRDRRHPCPETSWVVHTTRGNQQPPIVTHTPRGDEISGRREARRSYRGARVSRCCIACLLCCSWVSAVGNGCAKNAPPQRLRGHLGGRRGLAGRVLRFGCVAVVGGGGVAVPRGNYHDGPPAGPQREPQRERRAAAEAQRRAAADDDDEGDRVQVQPARRGSAAGRLFRRPTERNAAAAADADEDFDEHGHHDDDGDAADHPAFLQRRSVDASPRQSPSE